HGWGMPDSSYVYEPALANRRPKQSVVLRRRLSSVSIRFALLVSRGWGEVHVHHELVLAAATVELRGDVVDDHIHRRVRQRRRDHLEQLVYLRHVERQSGHERRDERAEQPEEPSDADTRRDGDDGACEERADERDRGQG